MHYTDKFTGLHRIGTAAWTESEPEKTNTEPDHHQPKLNGIGPNRTCTGPSTIKFRKIHTGPNVVR